MFGFPENPLRCGCRLQLQQLWQWLRQHRRVLDADAAARCGQPPELRGAALEALPLSALCPASAPPVVAVAVGDAQPSSLLVSWDSRNASGLSGFRVAFHAIDVDADAGFTAPVSPTLRINFHFKTWTKNTTLSPSRKCFPTTDSSVSVHASYSSFPSNESGNSMHFFIKIFSTAKY